MAEWVRDVWARVQVRNGVATCTALLVMASANGCGGRDAGDVGSTNPGWFASCSADDDCRQGSCLCGVCTIACTSDSTCEELNDLAECLPTADIEQCGASVEGSICGDDAERLGEPASNDDTDADPDSESEDEPDDEPNDDATDESSPFGTTDPDAPPAELAAAEQVDLLFVVDNSISMADKQELFARALPELTSRLANPLCIDDQGSALAQVPAAEPCPQGSEREFYPIGDMHVGIITSSLGGYGAYRDCVQTSEEASEQAVDMAHLLGSLPRGSAAAPTAASSGFLTWGSGVNAANFERDQQALVRSAGEFGCGWEAPLEAWYRFLVDPYPHTRIVRQPCAPSDTNNLCNGPETDGSGNLLVDQTILNQRAAFLRPNSVVAIVMLSDENDCSFKATGQSWRLSQTVNEDGGFNPAFRGAGACSDEAYGPNHECCQSCGQASVPAGCPTGSLEDGSVVPAGCEGGRRYGSDGLDDHPNLRCFQQKQRFGVDYLYPVERYSNALTVTPICPFDDQLTPDPNSPSSCLDGSSPVDNPLFVDLAYQAELTQGSDPDRPPAAPRPRERIFLAGVVGVPWQDIAQSTNASDPIVYRTNASDAPEAERVNWNWILGERNPESGIPQPDDPLMRESIQPRSGQNPATGESIATPDAGFMANAINGHEWTIEDNSDLQYACIFPLTESEECISQEEFRNLRDTGAAIPNCDCTDFGGERFQNPLCQAQNGSFDQTQRYAKAYPSLRQLQVLYDYGSNSIVASICAAETSDEESPNYGYRPAVAAIVDRLKPVLTDTR